MRLLLISLTVIFFLLAGFAKAEVRVLYFFNPESPFSQAVEQEKEKLRIFWEDRVEWVEYNFQNASQRVEFVRYEIFSLPVALVDCFGELQRIGREDFIQNLNSSINACLYFCNGKFVPQKECIAGQKQNVSCGFCGFKIRTCNDICRWEETPCLNQGVCEPGSVEERECFLNGLKGKQQRFCDQNCRWSGWSACLIEKSFVPPQPTQEAREQPFFLLFAILLILTVVLVLRVSKKFS